MRDYQNVEMINHIIYDIKNFIQMGDELYSRSEGASKSMLICSPEVFGQRLYDLSDYGRKIIKDIQNVQPQLLNELGVWSQRIDEFAFEYERAYEEYKFSGSLGHPADARGVCYWQMMYHKCWEDIRQVSMFVIDELEESQHHVSMCMVYASPELMVKDAEEELPEFDSYPFLHGRLVDDGAMGEVYGSPRIKREISEDEISMACVYAAPEVMMGQRKSEEKKRILSSFFKRKK